MRSACGDGRRRPGSGTRIWEWETWHARDLGWRKPVERPAQHRPRKVDHLCRVGQGLVGARDGTGDTGRGPRNKDAGMDLSYTQNLEDYHLSLAFAGQRTGTYIDIGGGHPIADNVSFWFYERGWQGIVVEPQPELAALYQRLRPRDVAIACLIG